MIFLSQPCPVWELNGSWQLWTISPVLGSTTLSSYWSCPLSITLFFLFHFFSFLYKSSPNVISNSFFPVVPCGLNLMVTFSFMSSSMRPVEPHEGQGIISVSSILNGSILPHPVHFSMIPPLLIDY